LSRVVFIPEPSHEVVASVARNMRERDRTEVYATQWRDDPDDLARMVGLSGAMRWAVTLDGEPVAAIGVTPRWPKVWSAWAFGTDKWPKVVIPVTRHVRRFMLPGVYSTGALRVDCMALASHTDARRWLEYLGAIPEKTVDNWGKNGEKFVSYVWTRKQTRRIVEQLADARHGAGKAGPRPQQNLPTDALGDFPHVLRF